MNNIKSSTLASMCADMPRWLAVKLKAAYLLGFADGLGDADADIARVEAALDNNPALDAACVALGVRQP